MLSILLLKAKRSLSPFPLLFTPSSFHLLYCLPFLVPSPQILQFASLLFFSLCFAPSSFDIYCFLASLFLKGWICL
jgi:hypothetical protein